MKPYNLKKDVLSMNMQSWYDFHRVCVLCGWYTVIDLRSVKSKCNIDLWH